jgi:PPOX class probable F420-dependent enzyme
MPIYPFDTFVDQHTVSLTSFRRDGRAVATPVSIAVDADRAYVRTYESSGKFKRIRRDPHVEIAPSTLSGKPTGPAIAATARVLSGHQARWARELIERKHPWLHRLLVPAAHRVTGKRTVYLELTPAAGQVTDVGDRAA